MGNDEVTIAYTTSDPHEADVLRVVLEAAGIRCEMEGERQAGFTGLGVMTVRLLVRTEDLERARAIIADHQRM